MVKVCCYVSNTDEEVRSANVALAIKPRSGTLANGAYLDFLTGGVGIEVGFRVIVSGDGTKNADLGVRLIWYNSSNTELRVDEGWIPVNGVHDHNFAREAPSGAHKVRVIFGARNTSTGWSHASNVVLLDTITFTDLWNDNLDFCLFQVELCESENEPNISCPTHMEPYCDCSVSGPTWDHRYGCARHTWCYCIDGGQPGPPLEQNISHWQP